MTMAKLDINKGNSNNVEYPYPSSISKSYIIWEAPLSPHRIINHTKAILTLDTKYLDKKDHHYYELKSKYPFKYTIT